MNVVVCDDNEEFLNQLVSIIEKYAFIEENSIKVTFSTTNPDELLQFIGSKQPADCFFLDINFNGQVNGLDLAKSIRKKYPLVSIIFVTTHSEMLQLTMKYKVEALDFIIKDAIENLQSSVTEVLAVAYEKYKNIGKEPVTRYFQLNSGGFIKNIKYDDILYFKASESSHKVTLVSKSGIFEFYESLDDIEKYSEQFFRCHRGYIINLDNVKLFDKKSAVVVMENDEHCPVAHRRIKEFEQALHSRYYNKLKVF